MARQSRGNNYPYEPEEYPILTAWPEFWWLNETDRANLLEALAIDYGGEGYRNRKQGRERE